MTNFSHSLRALGNPLRAIAKQLGVACNAIQYALSKPPPPAPPERPKPRSLEELEIACGELRRDPNRSLEQTRLLLLEVAEAEAKLKGSR